MLNRENQPQVCDLNDMDIRRPERVVMPNGVVLSVIDAAEEEVVRVDVVVKAGNWFQKQRLQAMFTNRMLREGTKCYAAAEIAEQLDYYGGWLELSLGSEYAYVTLYTLNKYAAETFAILESMLKEPLFAQKELDTVLEMNLQMHLVSMSKVDVLAHRELLRVVHGPEHPLGNLAVADDFKKITPEVLSEFYQEFYHAENCAVFVSGKVTADIRRMVTDLFGTEKFGAVRGVAVRTDYPIVNVEGKRFFCEREDVMQSAVKLGCATIRRNHPDYLDLRILMTLFGGYFGSRLMSNIREEKGYTYGISAGILFYPANGVMLVTAETDNRYVEPMIGEIYHEIDRLQTEKVPGEELNIVCNYMIGDMCRNYETAFSLADAWIYIYTSELDDGYFERSLQSIRNITPERLEELAQQYLCKENLKEVVAGKRM